MCVVANKAIGIGPSHSLLVLAFGEAKPGLGGWAGKGVELVNNKIPLGNQMGLGLEEAYTCWRDAPFPNLKMLS